MIESEHGINLHRRVDLIQSKLLTGGGEKKINLYSVTMCVNSRKEIVLLIFTHVIMSDVKYQGFLYLPKAMV